VGSRRQQAAAGSSTQQQAASQPQAVLDRVLLATELWEDEGSKRDVLALLIHGGFFEVHQWGEDYVILKLKVCRKYLYLLYLYVVYEHTVTFITVLKYCTVCLPKLIIIILHRRRASQFQRRLFSKIFS